MFFKQDKSEDSIYDNLYDKLIMIKYDLNISF